MGGGKGSKINWLGGIENSIDCMWIIDYIFFVWLIIKRGKHSQNYPEVYLPAPSLHVRGELNTRNIHFAKSFG